LSNGTKKGWQDLIASNEVKQELLSSGKPWSGLMDTLIKNDKQLASDWERFKELIPKKLWGNFNPKRIGNLILFGDTRSAKEIADFVAKRGAPEYVVRRVFTYFVIFPVIEGIVSAFVYASMGFAESLFPDEYRPEWVDWNETQNWRYDFIDQFKEQFKEKFSAEGLLKFADFTMLDELILVLKDWLPGGGEDNNKILEGELKAVGDKTWKGFSAKDKQSITQAAEDAGVPIPNSEGESSSSEETSTESPEASSIASDIESELKSQNPSLYSENFRKVTQENGVTKVYWKTGGFTRIEKLSNGKWVYPAHDNIEF
jgi:hypothetical protein